MVVSKLPQVPRGEIDLNLQDDSQLFMPARPRAHGRQGM